MAHPSTEIGYDASPSPERTVLPAARAAGRYGRQSRSVIFPGTSRELLKRGVTSGFVSEPAALLQSRGLASLWGLDVVGFMKRKRISSVAPVSPQCWSRTDPLADRESPGTSEGRTRAGGAPTAGC